MKEKKGVSGTYVCSVPEVQRPFTATCNIQQLNAHSINSENY